MSTDPKIEKLIAAMKKVPEKLAAKWIEASESTNAHIAELEKNFADKETEFKKVTDKLANTCQELSDLQSKYDKDITTKDSEIKKLKTELENTKNTPATSISDEFLNIVNKFINDITNIIDNNGTVINEVKPVKNKEKTVITDPVIEEKPKKKATTAKKETISEEKPIESETADDESVDAVLADLGITDL